jgi:hypothetical protein
MRRTGQKKGLIMKTFVAMLLLLAPMVYSQSAKDRKEIFELRTKCMEMAKDFCGTQTEDEMGNGYPPSESFYDVKRNRRYAICTWIHPDTTRSGNGFISVTLSDAQTGRTLAMYMNFWLDSRHCYGEINGEATTMKRAEVYIKKMTTE